MVVGASNLWFPATFSIIVMPESAAEKDGDLADRIRAALGDRLARYAGDLETLRDMLALAGIDVTGLTEDDLGRAVSAALAPPPSPEETEERLRGWDPVDLLEPSPRVRVRRRRLQLSANGGVKDVSTRVEGAEPPASCSRPKPPWPLSSATVWPWRHLAQAYASSTKMSSSMPSSGAGALASRTRSRRKAHFSRTRIEPALCTATWA
jgi:hypothetical protein